MQIIPANSKQSSNNQTYDALIARISNLTIRYVTNSLFNISFQYDIYNPNPNDVQFQAPDSCGLNLLVSMNSTEDPNENLFVNNACSGPASTVTIKPGFNIQTVSDASILLINWPENNQFDLPIAEYSLTINHTYFNMTSYGAALDYKGSGQFSIFYAQNPYTFWTNTPVDYFTTVPNSFSRTQTSTSISNQDLGFIIVILVSIIAVIVVVITYMQRKNANSSKNLEKPSKKVLDNSGTFNEVLLDKLCPVCGTKVIQSELFCSNCGNRI